MLGFGASFVLGGIYEEVCEDRVVNDVAREDLTPEFELEGEVGSSVGQGQS